MSTATTIQPAAFLLLPLVGRPTRAFFAPVNRTTKTPTLFDPAAEASWTLQTPPSPWLDLGWVEQFTRSSESKIAEVDAGVPPAAQLQVRAKLGATVSCVFAAWTKLTMALATGSQHMNVLAATTGAAATIGSGAKAIPASALAANSTATVLYFAGTAPSLPVGSMVVVDQDYAGQTGFVGSPISGAYVQSAAMVGSDPDYVRRVSFNVGRVAAIRSDGGLQLAAPLPGGVPSSGAKLQQVVALVDREGGSFFSEWSALFVVEGSQGDRMCFHYPRLQPCSASEEKVTSLGVSLQRLQPIARFRALPIVDGNDGEQVVCYRSFFPAASAVI